MTRLVWGIRAGFRDYLDALPDARVELTGGAERSDEGFVFPQAAAARFAGIVHATAHGGELDVTLADPALEDTGDTRVLTADVGGRRIVVAALLDAASLDALLAGTLSSDVALSHDGAAWLGGAYGPWARMDPVVVLP